MTEERRALIDYRLDMARATLNDAKVLHNEGGSSWSIVNRAYYAMFYSTLALLVWLGLGASKHSGVIAIFDQHLVRAGHLPQEMSKWLHKAFDMRQIGDYRELAPLSEEQAEEVLQWAQDFVAQTEKFLSAKFAEGN